MELFLIRHPRVKIDAGICYGQSDVPLADSIADLGFLQQGLPEKYDCIFTSPLRRCNTIAHQLNGSEIIIDDRLQELNFGNWELKQWNDIPIDLLDAWAADVEQFKIPGGESGYELHERVMQFFKTLMIRSDIKTAVVITHAGVIRCLLAYACRLALQEATQLKIDYASITKCIVHDGQIRVEYFSKTVQGCSGL